MLGIFCDRKLQSYKDKKCPGFCEHFDFTQECGHVFPDLAVFEFYMFFLGIYSWLAF
jgi:hypothetical protein